MEDVQIDWLVVSIGAILNMVIGFLWYSQWLFGPIWMKLSKHTSKEMKGDWKTWVSGLIVSFVIVFFLALFEGYVGVTSVTDGMCVGFLAWLGFVATTQISSVIWCKKPFKLFLIDTGHKLLSFLVISGFIGA